jgi:hypothetical protein
MILKNPLWLLTVFWLPVAVHAQQNDAVVPLHIRAVLHDPVHPVAELYLTDRAGAMVRLDFLREGFSKMLATLPVNGSLVLYDKADIDPKKPMANVAAICKIPVNTKRAMVVVMPTPAGEKPAYRMVLIDDSEKAFPKGESRALPLVTVEMAIQAGEHRLPIHPGVITNVPAVKKLNQYNLAQTNFYYKQGDAWVAFAERQLQYLDAYRRIFIIHVTPGAIQPTVTTIVDTTPPELRR